MLKMNMTGIMLKERIIKVLNEDENEYDRQEAEGEDHPGSGRG